MTRVYITSHNGTLREYDEILLYEDYLGNKTKILIPKVKQIIVIGRLSITSGAFNLLLKFNTGVIFIRHNGKYTARLLFDEKKNTIIRHRQHSLYDNPARVLELAKDIVRGKMHNQYLFLQRISRKYANDIFLNASISELKRIRMIFESANNIEQVRGFEGEASHIYFSCLGRNIQSEWTSFSYRTKNPPLDPVNSVLSFLYTILAIRIESYVYQEGLDPSIGTLHALCYGRSSLVFDLIEEFRTPIVDTLTCAIFNMKILNKEDFKIEKMNDIISDDELKEQEETPDAVLLTKEGMDKVIKQFEKKLSNVHFHPFSGQTLSYDKILREQVILYKQVVGGLVDHYMPLIVT